jgi:hypothetical protein
VGAETCLRQSLSYRDWNHRGANCYDVENERRASNSTPRTLRSSLPDGFWMIPLQREACAQCSTAWSEGGVYLSGSSVFRETACFRSPEDANDGDRSVCVIAMVRHPAMTLTSLLGGGGVNRPR